MLTNEWWSAASDSEAASVCETIAASAGITFAGLEPREYAGRSFRSALFRAGGAEFSLVPGGEYTLGFDIDAYRPSRATLASYADSAGEYGLGELRDFLALQITPVRKVRLDPFLIEVRQRNFAAESVDDLAAEIAPFRLPTSDEWELACGGGARTLFRWGDDYPEHAYPTDKGGWNLHRVPNLYGLEIASNPYDTEVVADDAYRGGDGGTAICGGAGFFLGWLPLATSYTLPEELAEPYDDDPTMLFYRRVRAIEL